MSTQAQLRNRYAREAVTTATPSQLVVMLYDRLLKDFTVAETAIAARDIQGSHSALMHAQDIVHELDSSLDISVWRDGEALKRLYEYVIYELTQANMEKDAVHVQNARDVIEPIRDAWHQVAASGVSAEK